MLDEQTRSVGRASYKKGKREFIHLVNLSGEHQGERIKIFEFVPPVYGAEVVYKCKRKPKNVLLRPHGGAVEFTYAREQMCVKIDKIDIYEILEIIG